MILASKRKRSNSAMSPPSASASGSDLPGNDGAWFLKAVGVAAPPTALTDVGGKGESTTELVNELWQAEGTATGAAAAPDEFRDWVPGELSPTIGRDRNFRWSVVAAVAILLAALAAVAVWLPGTSEQRAQSRSDEYRQVLVTIRTDLPEAQAVLAVVTDPAADASQFPDLIPTVADLNADADEALNAAALALPTPWPLASDEPFQDLEVARQAVSQEATVAESIARRLGDVLDYRTVFAGFLATGDLPRTAGSDLNELNTLLAATTADSATILTELPADAAFAAHTQVAHDTLDRFVTWQVEYVDALRTDSADVVAARLDELEQLRADLDAAMLEALAQTRSEIDSDIITLAGTIELTMSELP